jgi:hypothetical protein
MRTRIVLCWTAAAALSLICHVSFAQTTNAPQDDRLDRFERRLSELEADVKARDEEIARLKSQLNQPRTTRPTDDEIERTRDDVLRDLESREAAASPLTLRRPAASFNPDIAVVIDTLGTWSNQRSNDAWNRFDVREAELDLRAAIDPRADGVLVVSFERDVHNPPFPEAGDEEEEGVESSANIEEGYAFFHDFGVPNLTAKLGRFHLRFGRQNVLHLHDLPTSDPPLVNQAFLAPESLIDSGLSLSYVIPPRLVGDQYVELIAEIVTGEGAHSESPTLSGDIEVDSPAFNLHALWNRDLTEEINLELGGSWLTAQGNESVNLYGVDATLVRRGAAGRFDNQLLQAEAIYGSVAGESAWGFYVLGQQQLHKDWYAGLRVDWTENPLLASEEMWAISPYVSWYWSEFLRFRVEYQHRDGDVENADVLYVQATFIFGAHPPHPYWSMR